MKKPEKIEKCPWCHGKASWSHTSGGNGSGISVMCNDYRCASMGPQLKTQAGAIRAWNRVAKRRRNR